jgi:hypothetical protein
MSQETEHGSVRDSGTVTRVVTGISMTSGGGQGGVAQPDNMRMHSNIDDVSNG